MRRAVRAIDFHVHLPTPEWLDGSMRGYVEAAERYFRSTVARKTIEELAQEYRDLDVRAVILAWDAETATQRPRVPNELVADACARFPEVFTGFGSVDPHKPDAAEEVERIAGLGLRGVKLHPSLQAFSPDDERFFPIYAACEQRNLVVLFHTGTSGIGGGTPGGQGIRIDLAHPLRLDPVAAAHPALQIIAAHTGWPWHLDLVAMALHKTNLHIDISGWAPRYLPAEVVREMCGRLNRQFLFGSDYPFIHPARCLEDLATLGLHEEALQRILVGNGAELLGIQPG